MTAIIATLVRHAPLSWTFTRSRSLLLLLLLLLLNSACRCAALDERYEFQVNEESEVGTPVGVVTLKTGLKYKFVVGNAGGNGAGGGSSDDPLFSLDDNSGEITVQGRLDRESLGDIVEFVLTSYPSSRHVVEVLVHIVDINDNAPKFPAPRVSVQFRENMDPGQHVILSPATDADIGRNAELSEYRVVNGDVDNAFKVTDRDQQGNRLGHLYLYTAKRLDRERRQSYVLTVVTNDLGSAGTGDPLTASLQVHVEVKDVNDNSPRFTRQEYHATVDEVTPTGSLLVQLNATDKDSSDASSLVYSLLTDHSDQFRVHPSTGQLTNRVAALTCPCDHHDPSVDPVCRCSLTVAVKDAGGLSDTAYVTVRLVDLNDHAPVIQIYNFHQKGIAEDTENNTVVAFIGVTDADVGDNGNVTMTLAPADYDHPFTFHPGSMANSYILKLKRQLNMKESSSHVVVFLATDHGSPPMTSNATLILNVISANLEPPTFDADHYNLNISETALVGYPLDKIVFATSDDGYLTYDLSWPSTLKSDFTTPTSLPFRINPLTAVITVYSPLDYETTTLYNLVLTASNGNSQKSVNLTISVLDVNDYKPRFTRPWVHLTPTESSFLTLLGSLPSVLDPDSFTTNYRVTTYNRRSVTIDRNGFISLLLNLDREDEPSFQFDVEAKDSSPMYTGDPSTWDICTVVVDIVDVDDNVPTFQQSAYFFELNTTYQSTVLPFGRVVADDLDGPGRNSLVNYVLHNSQAVFRIDSNTGDLYLKAQIPASNHIAIISAFSLGRPNESSLNVSVTLTVRQSSSPPLTPALASPRVFLVYFNVTADDVIGQLTILDGTDCRHTVLRNTAGQRALSVSERDGDIRVVNPNELIYRNADQELWVRVVCGVSSIQLRAEVKVHRPANNDNNLALPRTELVLYFDPNTLAPHQPVYRFPIKLIYYTIDIISDKVFAAYFSLKGNMLSISENFTSSSVPRLLTTEVAVSNLLGVILRRRIKVHMIGSPHLPRFDSASLVISASENDNPPRHLLHRFPAPPAFYSYSLHSTSSHFDLLADGRLLLTRRLRRNESDSFLLLATLNGPYSNSTCRLFINVREPEASSPAATKHQSAFELPLDEGAGYRIGRILPDESSSHSTTLQFSVLRDARFSVDSRTGELFVRQTLLPSEYSPNADHVVHLDVLMSDLGSTIESRPLQVGLRPTWTSATPARFNPPTGHSHFYVSEDHYIAEPFARLNVLTGRGDRRLSFSLVPSQHSSMFYVDDEGDLTITSTLDRETTAEYRFQVLLEDLLDDRRRLDTRLVVVTVTDVNDNAPNFTDNHAPRGQYTLWQDTPLGEELFTVKAVDRDAGVNGRLVYSLESTTPATFRVHPRTGAVTLNARLVTSDARHTITCIATDGGGLSTRLQVAIEVKQRANPYIRTYFPLDTPTSITVPESTPFNEELLRFQATSNPASTEHRIRYSLLWVWPAGQAVFRVHEVTGWLTFDTAHLDSEKVSVYRISVMAFIPVPDINASSSSEILQHSATHQLTLNVSNTRDSYVECISAPAVLVSSFSTSSPTSATVSPLLDTPTRLNYALECHTTHSSSSSTPVYTLDSSRLDGPLFTLHHDDHIGGGGVDYLRFSSESTPIAGVYRAAVLADARQYEITALVVVGSPTSKLRFSESVYGVDAMESVSPETTLLTISASLETESRDDNKVAINYFLLTAGEYFHVNATTGQLTTSSRPDALDVDSMPDSVHELKVAAIRMDNFEYNVVTVRVRLIDVNDNVPQFSQPFYRVYVQEDTITGKLLVDFNATDQDFSAVFNTCYYKLKDPANNEYFYTHHALGGLYIGDHVPAIGVYHIRVVAYNAASHDVVIADLPTSEVLVEVIVDQVVPEFYWIDIYKFTSIGTKIHTLKNMPTGAKFHLKDNRGIIESTNEGVITLLRDSGAELSWFQNFNFDVILASGEVKKMYVMMNVLNLREHAPTIYNNTIYVDEVQDSASSLQDPILVNITVTSNDQAPHANLRCSIIAGDPFHIYGLDAETCKLYARKPQLKSAKLIVKVVDSEEPTFFSNATVDIIVKPYLYEPFQVLSFNECILNSDEIRQQDFYTILTTKSDSRHFLESHSTIFKINETTGSISLLDTASRPNSPTYNISLRCEISSSPGDPHLHWLMIRIRNFRRSLLPPPGNNPTSISLSVTSHPGYLAPEVAFSPDAYITGDPLHRFRLSSGRLFLRRPLYQADRFAVQIRKSSDSHQVWPLNITVEAESQPFPRFRFTSVRVNVLEGKPTGSRRIVDAAIYISDCLGCAFSSSNSAFKVDSTTGIIVSDAAFTFGDKVQFIVSARKLLHTSRITINVHVVQSNMYSPDFHLANETLLVKVESFEKDAILTTVKAWDLDENQNGVVRYHIEDDHKNLLTIDPVQGILYAKRQLVEAEYAVKVVAHDLAIKSKQSEINVIFSTTLKTVCFPEIYSNYTVVEGEQLKIKISSSLDCEFSIYSGDVQEHTFALVRESGANTYLVNQRKLDREEIDAYVIVILGVTKETTQVFHSIVSLSISDVNDNNPKFAGYFSGEIQENSVVDSFVMRVSSFDADIGDNALVKYKLLTHGDEFSINEDSGIIRTRKPLDRESRDSYNVQVTINDAHYATSTTIPIKVLDANDNSPQFLTKDSLFFVARSSLIVGRAVADLKAEDADIADNARLTYSLQDFAGLFTISSTGQLLVQTAPDNTTIDVYSMIVGVCDRGVPTRCSSRAIDVQLVPGEHSHPLLANPDATLYYNKWFLRGFKILRLIAANEFDVEFFIESNEAFEIHRETGWITVKEIAFLRKIKHPHEVNVTLRFRHSKLQSSVKTVYPLKVILLTQPFKIIEFTPPPISAPTSVAPVAGNPSKSTSSSTFPRTLLISEDFIPGTEILRISTNIPAKFDLLSDNESFNINHTTGVLSLRKTLNYREKSVYRVLVRAIARHTSIPTAPHSTASSTTIDPRHPTTTTTAASPPSSNPLYNFNTVQLEINVRQVIVDNAEWTRPMYMFRVNENSPMEHLVGTVQGLGSNVTYDVPDVKDDNGEVVPPIIYVSANGEVRLVQSLDYEVYASHGSQPVFKVIVGTRNTLPGNKRIPGITDYVFAVIHIELINVNEYTPRFLQTDYFFPYTKNLHGTLKAIDLDSFSTVEYYVDSIYAETIKISRGFFREESESNGKLYSFKVFVKNKGVNKVSSCTVHFVHHATIQAIDQLNIIQSFYFEINEDVKIGTRVGVLTSRYNEEYINYKIINEIGVGDDLEMKSNNLVTKSTLDRETREFYTVFVYLNNVVQLLMKEYFIVFVRVINIDDNSPQLSRRDFYAAENIAAPLTLAYFSSMTFDLDNTAVNGDDIALTPPTPLPRNYYTYKLLPTKGARKSDQNLPFHVDPNSGRLSTTRSLNREDVSLYEMRLLILGRDDGRSSSVDIVVHMLDQNDAAPLASNRTVIVVRPAEDNLGQTLMCRLLPIDPDTTGVYTCLQRDSAGAVSEHGGENSADKKTSYALSGNCSLYSLRSNGGNSTLWTTTSDGGHVDTTTDRRVISNPDMLVRIRVHTYTPLELVECISLSVERPDLSAYYQHIVEFVLNIAGVHLYPVELTATPHHPAFMLFYGRRATGGETARLLSHAELKRRLDDCKQGLERKLNTRLAVVDPRSCNGGCFNGGRCQLLPGSPATSPTPRWVHLDGGALTIVTRNTSARYACSCTAEFEGVKCESSVSEVRCQSCGHGVCCRSSGRRRVALRTDSGNSSEESGEWACVCDQGWKGQHCEDDIDECKEQGVCSNRGICVNLIGSHNCTCNKGYNGPKCEYSDSLCPQSSCSPVIPPVVTATCDVPGETMTFALLSHVQLLPVPFDALNNTLTLQFRTVDKNSVIAYIEFDKYDYISIQLINEIPVFVWKVGDYQEIKIELKEMKLADGKWKKINIHRYENIVTMYVEKCSSLICDRCFDSNCQQKVVGMNNLISTTTTLISLGGIREITADVSNRLSYSDFTGCIREFKLDGINLLKSKILHQRATKKGCSERVVCDENLCSENGVCSSIWTERQCRCYHGSMGKFCDLKREGNSYRFDSSSMVHFRWTEVYARAMIMSYELSSQRHNFKMRFKTTRPNSILVFSGDKDTVYSVLYTMSGIVYWYHSELKENIFSVPLTVNDGFFHTLTFSFDRYSLSVSMDDYSELTVKLNIEIDLQNIRIGHHMKIMDDLIEGFDGCISSLSYDDISLPLYKEAHAHGTHYQLVSQSNVDERCSGHDLVAANSRMVIVISLLCVLIATVLIGAILVYVFLRYRRKRGDKMSQASRLASIGMTTYATPSPAPPTSHPKHQHHHHHRGNGTMDVVFPGDKLPRADEDKGVDNGGYETAERYDIDKIDSTMPSPYADKVRSPIENVQRDPHSLRNSPLHHNARSTPTSVISGHRRLTPTRPPPTRPLPNPHDSETSSSAASFSDVNDSRIHVPRSIVTSPILAAISSDDDDDPHHPYARGNDSSHIQRPPLNDPRPLADRVGGSISPAYIQQHHASDNDSDSDQASTVCSSNLSRGRCSDDSFTCSEMGVARRPFIARDLRKQHNHDAAPTPGAMVAGLPLEAQKWDYLLNYGPSFNSLVGVCNDIANLPDANKPKSLSNGSRNSPSTSTTSTNLYEGNYPSNEKKHFIEEYV